MMNIAKFPPEVTISFVRVSDGMPMPGLECIIYVHYEDEASTYYGKHNGEKWLGIMPWESCFDCGGTNCVALDEIQGTVVAWAPFPQARRTASTTTNNLTHT